MSLPASQNKRHRYAVLLIHTGSPVDLSFVEVWRYLRLKLGGERLIDPMLSWLWTPILHLCILPWQVRSVQRTHRILWVHNGNAITTSGKEELEPLSVHQSGPQNVVPTLGQTAVFGEDACRQLSVSPSPAASPRSCESGSPNDSGPAPLKCGAEMPSAADTAEPPQAFSKPTTSTPIPMLHFSPTSSIQTPNFSGMAHNGASVPQPRDFSLLAGGRPDKSNCSACVYFTSRLASNLQLYFEQQFEALDLDAAVQVECAFLYQKGSVDRALEKFQLLGDYSNMSDSLGDPVVVQKDHLILLPLLPQYNPVGTARSFDAVMRSAFFQHVPRIPSLHFISSYCTSKTFLSSMELHIRSFFRQFGTPAWLFIAFPSALQMALLGKHNTPHSELTFDRDREYRMYEKECFKTFVHLRHMLGLPRTISSLYGSPECGDYMFSSQSSVSPPQAALFHDSYLSDDVRMDSTGAGLPPLRSPASQQQLYTPRGASTNSAPCSSRYPTLSPYPVSRIRLVFVPPQSSASTVPPNRANRQRAASPEKKGQIPSYLSHTVIRDAYRTDRRLYAEERKQKDGGDSSNSPLKPSPHSHGPTPRASVRDRVYVVCPGAVIDDESTLIGVQQKVVQQCEGLWKEVKYIPTLNDSAVHVKLLSGLLSEELKFPPSSSSKSTAS